jgi:hypothetical protein
MDYPDRDRDPILDLPIVDDTPTVTISSDLAQRIRRVLHANFEYKLMEELQACKKS